MTTSNDHPGLPFVQARGFTAGRPDGPPLWIVFHDMEASETSTRAESTAAYFANPSDGRRVSAHYCADNNSVVQCVDLDDSAWTVGNRQGNNRGINWELPGFARQTRAQWLDAYSLATFRKMAPIVRADAKRFNIPLRWLTDDQVRAMQPGLTTHVQLARVFGGSTHTDPGPAFPYDVSLEIMKGENMAISERDFDHLKWRVEAMSNDRTDYHLAGPQAGQPFPFGIRMHEDSAKLDRLISGVEALTVGGVDIDALAAKVAALLAPQMEAAAEAAVRRVLGELDETAPDTE